jgi:hypothetical protein
VIIIGMGRVGRGLKGLAGECGEPAQSVSRDMGWDQIDPKGEGPILVCVNAGDIASVIGRVPVARTRDLVFIQNGMLDTFLEGCECSGNTRGLLYFAVPSLGAPVQPGGPSVFTGQHSEAVVDWLQGIGLEAHVIAPLKFRNQMSSKLIWNCTFGLLCDIHDESVDMVVANHGKDVSALISDLVQISNRAIGTTLGGPETTEQLCAYSNSIRGYRATLKQWNWRNGWFVEAGKRLGQTDGCHLDLLAERNRRVGTIGPGHTTKA